MLALKKSQTGKLPACQHPLTHEKDYVLLGGDISPRFCEVQARCTGLHKSQVWPGCDFTGALGTSRSVTRNSIYEPNRYKESDQEMKELR